MTVKEKLTILGTLSMQQKSNPKSMTRSVCSSTVQLAQLDRARSHIGSFNNSASSRTRIRSQPHCLITTDGNCRPIYSTHARGSVVKQDGAERTSLGLSIANAVYGFIWARPTTTLTKERCSDVSHLCLKKMTL